MSKLQAPQATSALSAWLDYIEHLHGRVMDLGLERVAEVANKMGLLTPAPVVITVAGTNGKGTTCRVMETILQAAGYRVGVYSSPHLLSYAERIRIQGQELPEAELSAGLAAIEQGRGDISLTYFEFSTLLALHLLKQAAVEVAILEVGLGGRLDAVNIVDADVAVITSIALDHTDWLGDSRESIGREKAGIIRSGRPVVVGEADMPASIGQVARQQGARLYCQGQEWHYRQQEQGWCWQMGATEFNDLPLPNIPLANAATALAALCCSPLSVSRAAIEQGLHQAQLPGRFQTISDTPRVILDVAHNPHAAGYLAARLQQLSQRSGKLRAVVGMLADKDIAGTLACLRPLVQIWYCAPLTEDRGAAAELLAEHLPQPRLFNSVGEAWQQAMSDAQPDDTVLVFGSFFTVTQVMMLLQSRRSSGQ